MSDFNFQLGHSHFSTVTILRGCCLRALDVRYQQLLLYYNFITALGSYITIDQSIKQTINKSINQRTAALGTNTTTTIIIVGIFKVA